MLRLAAITIFGLMFLSEAVDIYGLILTLAEPAAAADRSGIDSGAEILRGTVVLLLGLVVACGALFAMIGLLSHRSTLYHHSAVACALGYLVYGLFQVADGALHVGSGIVVIAGLIYAVLGGIAYAIHRSLR